PRMLTTAITPPRPAMAGPKVLSRDRKPFPRKPATPLAAPATCPATGNTAAPATPAAVPSAELMPPAAEDAAIAPAAGTGIGIPAIVESTPVVNPGMDTGLLMAFLIPPT